MAIIALLGMFVVAGAQGLPGPIPNADLYVSCDNRCDVYLNRRVIARLYNWWEQSKYSVTVKPGDVIVVAAKDDGAPYGAMAALISTKKACVTKVGAGPWRAAKEGGDNLAGVDFLGQDPRAIEVMPFPSKATVVVPGPGTFRSFSYETTGAEYVWAEDAGKDDPIIIRLQVTDECV